MLVTVCYVHRATAVSASKDDAINLLDQCKRLAGAAPVIVLEATNLADAWTRSAEEVIKLWQADPEIPMNRPVKWEAYGDFSSGGIEFYVTSQHGLRVDIGYAVMRKTTIL